MTHPETHDPTAESGHGIGGHDPHDPLELDQMRNLLIQMQRELEDFKAIYAQHTGLDYGQAGPWYPHPNCLFHCAVFGSNNEGGDIRIDTRGIHILNDQASGGDLPADRSIYFFEPADGFQNDPESSGVDNCHITGSVTPTGSQLQLYANHVTGEALVNLRSLSTGSYVRLWPYFQAGGPLSTDIGAPTAPDGLVFYRSDTDKLRLLSAGAWKYIANEEDVILQTLADAKGDIIGATAADTWARLAVGSNGQVLTADSAESTGLKWADAAGMQAKVLQADDVVNNSTTLQDVGELNFSIGANETYIVEGYLIVESGTVPDIKFDWTVPTGCSGHQYFVLEDYGNSQEDGVTIGSDLVVPTSGDRQLVRLHVGFVNGANAGTCQLQHAQNTADASNTTVYEGSYIKYLKGS